MTGIIVIGIVGVVIIAIIAIVAFIIFSYNDLVKKRNKVKNSWAHIDAQLQRRFDLIPSLVETVKGFAAHEERILGNMNASRDAYIQAHTHEEKLTKNAELTSFLKSLYVVAEHYPQLKSDMHFLKLQNSLAEIEEDITYARQFYNDAVTIYNNKLMSFPNNIIASKFNFKEEMLFDASKEAEVAPRFRFKERHQCPVCGASVSDNDINCEYCGCDLK